MTCSFARARAGATGAWVTVGNHRQFSAHAALLHTDPFEAIIDTELLPGDILYIPPGFPHEGVTLEESMSFSVGFRAKSACDMLSGLADYVIDKDLGSTLLTDPHRPIHQHQGLINTADFARIKAHLQSVLDNDTLVADFAGSYFSKTKCALDLQALDEPLDAAELINMLQDQPLVRTGGLRCFYVDATVGKGRLLCGWRAPCLWPQGKSRRGCAVRQRRG
jgi:50S ribosomal protein L16 3-hydroxylase